MDLMELGAIGELVGGVAVIASLIFVGLQVRSSAREQRIASMREATRDIGSLVQSFTSPAQADFFIHGISDFVSLSTSEQLRFSGIIGYYARLFEQLYYQNRHGGLERDVWIGFSNQIRDVAAYPGIQAWWPTRRHWYGPQFAEFFESCMTADNRPRLFGEREATGRPAPAGTKPAGD